ncbi:MAG TPA: hypothetical protein VGI39_03670 [Polyangiaceae bacterium]|jgi:hypothetical protein
MQLSSHFEATRRKARRAYELGRLRQGALRALALASVAGVGAFVGVGSAALVWLPLTVLVWTGLEWKGGALLRGGRIGAGGGLATLVVPLWVFRSCCRAGDAMMGKDCCNMTGACTMVGGAIGLLLAVFLVGAPRGERWERALGMVLALLAVASVKCAELLAGEALGLLGGLAAGALASMVLAAFVERVRGLPQS